MLTVVLDTNILISAIIFGGKPRKVLSLVLTNKIKAFVSPYILFELKEILYKKFDFAKEKIEEVEGLIKENFTFVYPKKTLSIIKDVPADNRILECAVEAKVDYLITGDTKHILKLKKINHIKIVSAREFLEMIKKSRDFGVV